MKISRLDKKFSQVIEDGTFFMEILTQVNHYYISHPAYVANEEIGEFCGPQCHNDRFNLEKFHFMVEVK